MIDPNRKGHIIVLIFSQISIDLIVVIVPDCKDCSSSKKVLALSKIAVLIFRLSSAIRLLVVPLTVHVKIKPCLH